MVRNSLKFLLMFSCGLIVCLTIWYAIRYNVQIFKVGKTTCVQPKVSGTEPTTNTGFACPKTQWVDCMPTVGENAQKKVMCSAAYLNWAKQYCPNFKGAAL